LILKPVRDTLKPLYKTCWMPPSMTRTVFIETQGCQMNEADSELMLGLLAREGFAPTPDPNVADLLILNTCQIREMASDKAFSQLGRWGKLKKQRPEVKIAMAGCVAQQVGNTVFERMPYVDIVYGTQNIHDLPRLVRQVFDENDHHVIALDKQKEASTFDYFEDVTQVRQNRGTSAWVTIIEGCNYFCTYCVVPYTRGRQISRKPQSILDEVKRLAEGGVKEVTLLGQTVDAYGQDFNDRRYDLADLFHAVHAVDGLERIRFMTSHPLDLSDAMIDAIAELPKLMEHIHIPMQSGDDAVLKRMRRGYTAEDYYRLTDKIHERIPNVAITGDYIVGFPGESDEAFMNSIYSVSRAGLYLGNTAAYSARLQTPAAIWEERYVDQAIPQSVKEERLQVLNEAIRKQAMAHNTPMVGQMQNVLVEGQSKRNPQRLMGRNRQNKVINFDIPDGIDQASLVNTLVDVRVTEAYPFSLLGVLL
jgi:tRNA-2-methylthio-N6-dimethylallyladenosine synthase